MAGENYYLLSSLPSLGELGSAAPLSASELLEKSEESGSTSSALLKIMFSGDDLMQREAFLSGEIEEPEIVVLTLDQVRNEAPLPGYLVKKGTGSSGKVPVDQIWDLYYREAAGLAPRGSFLSRWVGYEVGLRNAFAVARAKALNLDAEESLVASDLASGEYDFSGTLNEWSSASTPLSGLKVLDSVRWRWIEENDEWFTFTDDEVVAYGAKLMLLRRWERLAKAESAGGAPEKIKR